MRILVMGGNGFVGKNLIKELNEFGHEIICYDLSEYNGEGSCISVIGGMEEFDKIREIMKGVDVVYHLISTTTPKSSVENPEYCISSNVVGTLKLLEICKSNNIKHIIFTSSGGTVYGKNITNPIDENHATDPVCTYGISKLAIEKLLHMYFELYGINYTIFRLANPYGRYQNPVSNQGAIMVFLYKAIRGDVIDIWGDGTVTRDYIFIDDVVNAMTIPLKRLDKSGLYNIGTGIGTDINGIVSMISEVTGLKLKVQYHECRAIDVQENILSIDKIKKELNWNPSMTLKEGVLETYQWMKKYY